MGWKEKFRICDYEKPEPFPTFGVYTISGHVKDTNGRPLVDMTVMLEDGIETGVYWQEVQTNENGYFEILGVSYGSYNILVSGSNIHEQKQTCRITVLGKNVTDIEIIMRINEGE